MRKKNEKLKRISISLLGLLSLHVIVMNSSKTTTKCHNIFKTSKISFHHNSK